jgi:hypothetical protein
VRASIILIALAVAGCSNFPDPSEPQQRALPHRPLGIDTFGMNDCLGSGAAKEFCEDHAPIDRMIGAWVVTSLRGAV